MVTLTFGKAVKKEILGFLNKAIDEDGFIVEKENPNQKVLTFDGEEITEDEFGGIKRGSEVFIKNDIVSLMRLSKKD